MIANKGKSIRNLKFDIKNNKTFCVAFLLIKSIVQSSLKYKHFNKQMVQFI